MKKKIGVFITFLTLIIVISASLLDERTKLEMAMNAERSIAGLTEKEVVVGDHTIRYLDTENLSKETILMIHGFGANKDNWIRLAKYFDHNYRIIAPDLPGFGESTIKQNTNYDAPEQTKRIKAFLEALDVTKVHIVGNSMGGYIAADFTSKHPELTRSTWLLNPLGVQSAKHSEMFEKVLEGGHPYVLPRNESEFRLLITKVFYEAPYSPDFAITALTEDFQDHYESNERIAYQIHKFSEGEINFSNPIEKSLKSVTSPLLIVWGDNDKILSPDGLRVLREHLPTATTIMMKDMGHTPMIEDPKKTYSIIQDFLKSHNLAQ